MSAGQFIVLDDFVGRCLVHRCICLCGSVANVLFCIHVLDSDILGQFSLLLVIFKSFLEFKISCCCCCCDDSTVFCWIFCSNNRWTRLFCHVSFVLQRPFRYRSTDVSLSVLTSPRYNFFHFACLIFTIYPLLLFLFYLAFVLIFFTSFYC